MVAEKTSYKNILKHSSIYIIGMLVSKAVGFIMIPIYTNYLVPSDYGTLELLFMTSDVMTILIGIGLAQSVLRLYYDCDLQKEKKEIVSTALITGLVAFSLIFGFFALKSDFVSGLVFGHDDSDFYFRIIFITMIFASGIEIPLTYLRAQQKSFKFVLINLARLIIQLSLNIYFIVFLNYGVLGVLYSGLISSLIIGAYLIISTFYETGFHFSLLKLRQLLIFGYPLIFSHFGAFILTYSDRYFLRHFNDLTEVGIYSLAYKFGMMVSILLLAPFHQFWMAEMYAIYKRREAQKTFRDIFTYSTSVSILFCFVLSMFIPEIIKLIAPESYWSSYKLVPLICIAYILVGMQSFTSCGILISKKTHLLAYSTAIAVIANILMNIALIPKWGAFGAAYATIGSFFIRFIVTFYFSQKVYYLKYDWIRLAIASGLAICLVVTSMLINVPEIYIAIIVKCLIAIAYVLILYFSGWFKPEEKDIIVKMFRSPKRIFEFMQLIKGNKNP